MSGGDSDYMRRNADDDDLGWLGNFDDKPSYSFDFGNVYDFGDAIAQLPDYMMAEPLPYYGIDDPGNFPRSDNNPGGYDPGASWNQPLPDYGVDIFDPGNYPRSDNNPGGYDPGASWNKPLPPPNLLDLVKKYGSKALDFIKKNPGLIAGGGGAFLGYLDKAPPSGGGVKTAYAGPKQQLTRTVTQGKYGPIAQHSVQAARGGIMQAYAQGGSVPIRTGNQLMEDGGFVMTKRAVDGAGGPQGIRQVLPQAQLFHGPGDGSGRDDRIKTGIRARDGGVTPALVSKREMYVPRQGVEDAGGPRKVHAMMKRLERRA